MKTITIDISTIIAVISAFAAILTLVFSWKKNWDENRYRFKINTIDNMHDIYKYHGVLYKKALFALQEIEGNKDIQTIYDYTKDLIVKIQDFQMQLDSTLLFNSAFPIISAHIREKHNECTSYAENNGAIRASNIPSKEILKESMELYCRYIELCKSIFILLANRTPYAFKKWSDYDKQMHYILAPKTSAPEKPPYEKIEKVYKKELDIFAHNKHMIQDNIFIRISTFIDSYFPKGKNYYMHFIRNQKTQNS